MKLCAISFKECWRAADGCWHSNGGFPIQMAGIASLFDEVTMLVVESPPKSGGIRLVDGAKIIPLRRPRGADLQRKFSVLFGLPFYWKTMAQHCREADVVHVPLPGDLPLLGLLTALVHRKRLLARYGSSWFTNKETTAMNRFTRFCMRLLAGGPNVMLATGEGDQPPAKNMHWIFSTALSRAEIAAITPDLDRDLAAPPRAVYVGRLSPEKGVANLIHALAALKQDRFHPLPSVTLAGDGPQRGALEQLVRELDCENEIRFAGQLDRPSLSEVLMRSDFCVQPSLTEGYSKAWLDAMAHGLPVLASEVGAARNVIGEDAERGWLVRAGDVEALAKSISRVIREKRDWAALRRRCRNFVEGRTLEAWGETIGTICARQWNLKLMEGKLR